MTGRRLLALALLVVGIGAVIWSSRPRRPDNVILITIDTMRPDRISAYGYKGHVTPNLDRLAEEGILFQNAFCDVTWTTPSMVSTMTGLYATHHGFRSSFQRLKPETVTLASILRQHGRDTAAIIASYPLHSVFGLNQGFNLYDEHFSNPLSLDPAIDFGPLPQGPPDEVPPSDDTKAMRWFLMNKVLGEAYRPDDKVSDRAIAWLRKERHDPFFLWIHYFGPHEKPTGLTGLENLTKERDLQIAAYDPDVLIVDKEIGRVLATLDELGLTDHTAVIVHADHGQSLMEHDYFGHGRNVLDPTARIPMILRAPGRIKAGRRESVIARNVDILPTVLDLLDLPKPIDSDGSSLLAPRDPGTSTYIETYLSGTWLFADQPNPGSDFRVGYRRLAVRTPQWKLVVNDPITLLDRDPEPLPDDVRRKYYSAQLYDLHSDPGETTNRILERPAIADDLMKRLWNYHAKNVTSAAPMPMDDTTRERLKALGYLAE